MCGALRVSNIRDFLEASLFLNVLNDSWGIEHSHLIVTEIPELFPVLAGVILGMAVAKLVATGVTDPDIVASAGSDESW